VGLKSDIKNAFLKSMGYDDMPSEEQSDRKSRKTMNKKVDVLSEEIKQAIIDFLQKQEFTITKMKASLEVEEIKTVAPLTADVLQSVTIVNGFGPGNVVVGTKGVLIPKLNLGKQGGQGGVLKATGHAYIGRNNVPGGDTNEDTTIVKLLDTTGE
jgi:hypothetical protein